MRLPRSSRLVALAVLPVALCACGGAGGDRPAAVERPALVASAPTAAERPAAAPVGPGPLPQQAPAREAGGSLEPPSPASLVSVHGRGLPATPAVITLPRVAQPPHTIDEAPLPTGSGWSIARQPGAGLSSAEIDALGSLEPLSFPSGLAPAAVFGGRGRSASPDREAAEELAYYLDSTAYGSPVVVIQVEGETTETGLRALATEAQCTSCVVMTVVRLEAGMLAAVLQQPRGPTTVAWSLDGSTVSASGPFDRLTPEAAVDLANRITSATRARRVAPPAPGGSR